MRLEHTKLGGNTENSYVDRKGSFSCAAALAAPLKCDPGWLTTAGKQYVACFMGEPP